MTDSTSSADSQDAQIAAIDRLIELINVNAEDAATQKAAFHGSDNDEEVDDDEQDVDDASDGFGSYLMWNLKEVIDWETGYYVDWKDTPSFIESVETLAELWNVTVDWGTSDPQADEFLKGKGVEELSNLAHDSLIGQGVVLWQWDTQGDAYAGFMTRDEDRSAVFEIAEILQVRMRPGNQSF